MSFRRIDARGFRGYVESFAVTKEESRYCYTDDDQEDLVDSAAVEVYGLGGAEAPETPVD